MKEIYVALIALIGVFFSGFISYFISRRNIELNKKSFEIKIHEVTLKLKEIQEEYSKSIHKERLKYYPKLYQITGGIGTLINSNKTEISKCRLETFFNKLVKWDEDYAIFCGPKVIEKLYRSRFLLKDIAEYEKKTKLGELFHSLIELEFELKKEIGVFTSENFDSNKNEFINALEDYKKHFSGSTVTKPAIGN